MTPEEFAAVMARCDRQDEAIQALAVRIEELRATTARIEASLARSDAGRWPVAGTPEAAEFGPGRDAP